MKYRNIVQELKETGDPNVMAFLKDVEKMKRMSKSERDYCLQNRWMHESVKKLIEDFIPYIIMVAYGYNDKTKTLTVLDLINEGIIGAYAAFEKSTEDGRLTKRRVCDYIKNNIRKAIYKDMNQNIAEYNFDVCVPEGPMNDEGLIMDIDRSSVRRLLTDMIEKKLGARDAGIVLDYYWGNIDDFRLIAVKYGVSNERARQIIKNVWKLRQKKIRTKNQ